MKEADPSLSTAQNLDELRKRVVRQVAFGDVELTVTDDEGKMPIVVALAGERLAVLVGRVANAGGSANVFVGRGDEMYQVSAVRTECARGGDQVDRLAVPSGADSTVGMFVDALVSAPRGLNLSMPRPYPEGDSIRASQLRELAAIG